MKNMTFLGHFLLLLDRNFQSSSVQEKMPKENTPQNILNNVTIIIGSQAPGPFLSLASTHSRAIQGQLSSNPCQISWFPSQGCHYHTLRLS